MFVYVMLLFIIYVIICLIVFVSLFVFGRVFRGIWTAYYDSTPQEQHEQKMVRLPFDQSRSAIPVILLPPRPPIPEYPDQASSLRGRDAWPRPPRPQGPTATTNRTPY